MKTQDPSLMRQFILYFILPVIVIIIASVIGVRLLVNDTETTVEVVNVQSNGVLGTEEVEYLYSSDYTPTTGDESSTAEGEESTESGESESSPVATESEKSSSLSVKNVALYIGLAICGGLIVLIVGAGVFLFIMPQKKSS